MRAIFMIVILFFISSCNENKKVETKLLPKTEVKKEKLISEDFDIFFKKFSTDSAFRISRVNFPLKGFNSDETNTNLKDQSYLWSKEDWLFYADEDFKNQKSEDILKTDINKDGTYIIFRIYKENSGYDIQYKFKENNKRWFLVNYSYKNF
jgi:hypothetical protein